MSEKKTVIILRGPAGSGKSTWTKKYSLPQAYIVSTDNYFINNDGDYVFDRNKLGYYHQCALEEFERLVLAGVPCIILDNTNIRRKDYKKYVDFGRKNSYTVFQKCFTGEYTSIHGVPIETVLRMRQTFEEDTELPHYKEEDTSHDT